MGRHEAWRLLWHAALVLSSCFLLAGAQGTTGIRIRVDPEVLKEGDRVTLTPEGVDLEVLSNCKWYRGAIEERSIIVSFVLTPVFGQDNGPAYTGKEIVTPNCSLSITDLKPEDSGTYSFKPEGVKPEGLNNTAATILTIAEPLQVLGLGPGQIAVIAAGCVLGVVCTGGLGYFLCTKTALEPGRHSQQTLTG